MRHGKKFNHLGRQTAHRKAMLANMSCSLIEHKRINTTVAKAKALKQFVEPLITKSKTDTTHNRRIVFSRLRQKESITELFGDVAAKIGDRPGGYTRILKCGFRTGDAAPMAFIELVGRPIAEVEEFEADMAGAEEVQAVEETETVVETVDEAVAEDADQADTKKD